MVNLSDILRHKCKQKAVRRNWIEKAVVKFTKDYILQENVAEWISKQVVKNMKYGNKMTLQHSLQARLNDIEISLGNFIKAIEAGIITQTTKTRLEELEAEKADLTDQLNIERQTCEEITEGQILYWLSGFFNGSIENKDYCERVIDTFVQSVYLYNDRIKIVFNYTGDNNRLDKELIDNIENSDYPDYTNAEKSSYKFNSPPPKKSYPNWISFSFFIQ